MGKFSIKQKNYFFVGIQAFLFFIYAISKNDNVLIISNIIKYLLWFVLAFGGLLIVGAILQLNKNLSPFPSPTPNSSLLTEGLFKYARHPIYSGIILVAFSYAILKFSISKMIIALLLSILFYFKSKFEEQLLSEKFENYISYMEKVGRFFPKILFK